ncbi:ras and ef-hand domain-containing protein [Anaeramoeba flamelloides]|uniref:Ras and ef-hand domain-containing protein n=1 Tax=Anaeramoeba flamelloides TaxID=1746091 RepID=A0ABQ8YIF1_9EUKA|nr:ras and ef-hand domain-containing protein [Anaeramoeba flamelloides]
MTNFVRELKIVLLGHVAVGKTSIALRFTEDKFDPNTESTIGASFLTKSLVIDETKYNLKIWDSAGQERYRSLGTMYYKDSDATILVYDVTVRSTFKKMKEWYEELKKFGPENIFVVVCANKTDLENHQIPKSKGEDFAKHNGLEFMETSAKEGTNIQDLFKLICQSVPEKVLEEKQKNKKSQISLISYEEESQKRQEEKSGCC